MQQDYKKNPKLILNWHQLRHSSTGLLQDVQSSKGEDGFCDLSRDFAGCLQTLASRHAIGAEGNIDAFVGLF